MSKIKGEKAEEQDEVEDKQLHLDHGAEGGRARDDQQQSACDFGAAGEDFNKPGPRPWRPREPPWERAGRKGFSSRINEAYESAPGCLYPPRSESSVRQVRSDRKAEPTYAARRNPTATSPWKCSGITFPPGHGNSGRRGTSGSSGNLLRPAETNFDPSTEAPYEPDDCPSGHPG